MQRPFCALTRNCRLIRLRKFSGQQPAGPAGDGEMLDNLEWASPEARKDQSSLLLFHKTHCGAVSIEKDKYIIPAHSLKTTRSSHSAQHGRHQTYSDALKNSFSPQTIPHWNSLSPSVANTRSTEEFRALLILQPFVDHFFLSLFSYIYRYIIYKDLNIYIYILKE